jgi:hypothetical protein
MGIIQISISLMVLALALVYFGTALHTEASNTASCEELGGTYIGLSETPWISQKFLCEIPPGKVVEVMEGRDGKPHIIKEAGK